MHEDEPATEKELIGHGVHTDEPVTATYVLGGQVTHDSKDGDIVNGDDTFLLAADDPG